MSFISFWLLGIALIVAQTSVLPYFPESLGRPDFLYILIAFAAYRFAWIPGILLTFTLGWVVDVIGAIYLGIYPLICLLAFVGLKLLTSRSLMKESTYQIPLVGVSYFLVQMFFYFINSLTLPEMLPDWSWGETLQRTALVMLSAIPLFLLFGKLHDYCQRRRLRAKPLRRRVVKTAAK